MTEKQIDKALVEINKMFDGFIAHVEARMGQMQRELEKLTAEVREKAKEKKK